MTASTHTLHMAKSVTMSMFKVLRNKLLVHMSKSAITPAHTYTCRNSKNFLFTVLCNGLRFFCVWMHHGLNKVAVRAVAFLAVIKAQKSGSHRVQPNFSLLDEIPRAPSKHLQIRRQRKALKSQLCRIQRKTSIQSAKYYI